MDPDATLRLLLDAVRDGDGQGVYDACMDLAAWIDEGGFLPAPSTPRRWLIGDQPIQEGTHQP